MICLFESQVNYLLLVFCLTDDIKVCEDITDAREASVGRTDGVLNTLDDALCRVGVENTVCHGLGQANQAVGAVALQMKSIIGYSLPTHLSLLVKNLRTQLFDGYSQDVFLLTFIPWKVLLASTLFYSLAILGLIVKVSTNHLQHSLDIFRSLYLYRL